MKRKILNPDPKREFYCWHVCSKCWSVYTHSVKDWDRIVNSECCHRFLCTFSTDDKLVDVEEHKQQGD